MTQPANTSTRTGHIVYASMRDVNGRNAARAEGYARYDGVMDKVGE